MWLLLLPLPAQSLEDEPVNSQLSKKTALWKSSKSRSLIFVKQIDYLFSSFVFSVFFVAGL